MKGVWYLQIWPGVRHTFRWRYVEWIMATWAVVWGAKLLVDPRDDFITASGAFDGLRYWFGSDVVFGTLITSLGILRLAALAINGTFRDTIYSRYSPFVRAGTAFFCCLAWLMVAMSVASASTQGAVTYPFPFILDMLTAIFVAGESGDTLRVHRNGRNKTGS